MKISEMNWQDAEAYLKNDDRCILPLGSTEQHAYLSLATDSILAERIAVESAEPLGIPVFPVMSYGCTPLYMQFPGTVDLKPETLRLVVTDILDSLSHHGFRRILIVNGHGGNMHIETFAAEWSRNKKVKVKFHNWFEAEETWKRVISIDPIASHASWMENFPWTRLKHVVQPDARKEPVDFERLAKADAAKARELLGDGNYGGYYQRSDHELLEIWKTAVEETRELLEHNW